MLIRDILRDKGSAVVTLHPASTVLDAARVLVEHNIGALVITEDDRVAGILSERDILRLAARRPELLEATRVEDVMSSDLVVGVPGDDVPYAMTIMTRNRVRHLPILDGGRLVGIVSIGDVVKASLTDAEAENRWLRAYIQGRA